ncbi:Fe-S cluster assembly ATPase SufC [Patescibacteria group bacterium]|nr:Fe-S cluster assembly ATPase SufC [Patescibacteria group bacterium]
MSFELGKNYCLLGKNGSGKSSLALTVMGHPKYEITQGDITLDAESIKELSAHERAKKGIFLAFQSIPEIKGVKLFEFLRTIYSAKVGEQITFLAFKKIIEPLVNEINIDRDFLWRDLNVGFSGGERRKIEILQLRLLEPKYIFLDEVDSGLDVDAFRSVATLMKELNSSHNTFIIITHYFSILDYIPVDHVYVLEN